MSPTYAERATTRNEELRASGLARKGLTADPKTMSDLPVEPSMVAHVFLRAWRLSRKMTLEQLAEQMGSKVSTISGWETGRRKLDLEDLSRLAAVYGVHPAALLLAPENGEATIKRMQMAGDLVERMSPDAAEEWLAMGKRIIRD